MVQVSVSTLMTFTWPWPLFLFSSCLVCYSLDSIQLNKDRTWARFLSLARSKLRLCPANHRPGYWSNLPCDWLSTAWAYSQPEMENGPWIPLSPWWSCTKKVWIHGLHAGLASFFCTNTSFYILTSHLFSIVGSYRSICVSGLDL